MKHAWAMATLLVFGGCVAARDAADGFGAKDASDATVADPNCGLPGVVTLTLDDGGAIRNVCVADGPAFGVQEPTAVMAKDLGDGTISDAATGLQWPKQALDGAHTQKDAWHACDQLVLAGHADWRLPTVAEVWTTVDLTRANPAVVLPLSTKAGQLVWTAVTRDDHGWTVSLDTGAIQMAAVVSPAVAWCVRTDTPLKPLPNPRFFKTATAGVGDYPIVTDAWTGLTWKAGPPSPLKSMPDAVGWCGHLNRAGFGWRLGTLRELASLLERQHDPPLDYTLFPQSARLTHTKSFSATDDTVHWLIDFQTGSTTVMDFFTATVGRCVRDP